LDECASFDGEVDEDVRGDGVEHGGAGFLGGVPTAVDLVLGI
jgi:hypothetical protein